MTVVKVDTLRLHYKAVLYNADSIIKWYQRGSQIFYLYNVCENVSRPSRYTQCKLKIVLPVYFLAKFDTS